MTRKQKFLQEFDNPKNKGILVIVTVPNCPEPESIFNPKANFEGKKKYYEKAYDDDLCLISFPKIKIINWIFKQE